MNGTPIPETGGSRKGGGNMSEEREMRLFEIMDEHNVDMDVAELLLQDEEEGDEQ